MMRRRFLLLLALLLASPALCAQGVYRSVMPDGKIVYGSKPEPGAKESKAVNLPAPNISTPPPRRAAAEQQSPGAPGAGGSDVKSALEALETARAALEAGREPKEGERIGIATKGGGSSKLTDAYFERIKSLESAVAAAQARLDAAQRGGAR